MVEVFKTNVTEHDDASMLVSVIHKSFPGYKANFDLEDCDKILRIKCTTVIQPLLLIDLLKELGFYAGILPDEPIPAKSVEKKINGGIQDYFTCES